MSTRRPRRWWVVGCLGLYAAAVALVVLTPISWAGIVAKIGEWVVDRGIYGIGDGWYEFIANILLFVPLGLLLTLLFETPWYGVALALTLSAGVELVQIVIPSREASLRDVLANVCGAAIGAALAWLIVLRRDRFVRTADTTP